MRSHIRLAPIALSSLHLNNRQWLFNGYCGSDGFCGHLPKTHIMKNNNLRPRLNFIVASWLWFWKVGIIMGAVWSDLTGSVGSVDKSPNDFRFWFQRCSLLIGAQRKVTSSFSSWAPSTLNQQEEHREYKNIYTSSVNSGRKWRRYNNLEKRSWETTCFWASKMYWW